MKFNVLESPKTYKYVLNRDPLVVRCNRCGSPVIKSDARGYTWQCMTCDEDLYDFETHCDKFHEEREYNELLANTRDLLLLDD